jgi:hypothetical protein
MNWIAREAHQIDRLQLFGAIVALGTVSSGSPLQTFVVKAHWHC